MGIASRHAIDQPRHPSRRGQLQESTLKEPTRSNRRRIPTGNANRVGQAVFDRSTGAG
ncbi:MAG: hypothetical protein KatS3mg110_2659 [Pirellulaceae bacterium]|nr:MAG: hypothetical protein KatS3mg110_2659 [Pirellulaceae bacterium]